MAEVNKELFILQQQLKQVHQKHDEATKQYEETKQCVHASVHVFMSTQLPMLAQHPINSYRETWVPLCGSVCVALSLLLVTHLG